MKSLHTFFQKLSIVFAAATILVLSSTTETKAQEAIDPDIIPVINPWNFEVRAGATLPSADLADATDAGLGLGLKLGYFFSDQVAVRADLESGFLTGQPIENRVDWKNTQLWHYTIGLEGHLTDRTVTDWRVVLNAGIGGSTITADAAEGSADDLDDLSITNDPFEESVLTINYGLKVGYAIGDYTDIFFGAMGYTMFTETFPGDDDVITSFPFTLGMSWRF